MSKGKSIVKEQIEAQNKAQAGTQEARIRQELAQKIKASEPSGAFPIILSIVGWILTVIFCADGVLSFIVGLVLIGPLVGCAIGGAIEWILGNGAKSERAKLEQVAQQQIQAAYAEADRRTQKQIETYDKTVKRHCDTVLKTPSAIAPMIDRTVMMLERMISHADAGPYIRFVEADLTFTVARSGITYTYQSQYANPVDNFDFHKERFRDLNDDAECEGLAKAVAILTIGRMKKKYSAASASIDLEHVDACVTMHFKAANKNFIPATSIL